MPERKQHHSSTSEQALSPGSDAAVDSLLKQVSRSKCGGGEVIHDEAFLAEIEFMIDQSEESEEPAVSRVGNIVGFFKKRQEVPVLLAAAIAILLVGTFVFQQQSVGTKQLAVEDESYEFPGALSTNEFVFDESIYFVDRVPAIDRYTTGFLVTGLATSRFEPLFYNYSLLDPMLAEPLPQLNLFTYPQERNGGLFSEVASWVEPEQPLLSAEQIIFNQRTTPHNNNQPRSDGQLPERVEAINF